MNSTDKEKNTNASLPWKSGEKLLSSQRDPLFLSKRSFLSFWRCS